MLMFACKMSRELRIIYWMKIRPQKIELVTVTCLEKNRSFFPDNLILFFNQNIDIGCHYASPA